MNGKRILELDGLRGIAILMAMSFHISPSAALFYDAPLAKFFSSISQMGWAGVDLFFVLSGSNYEHPAREKGTETLFQKLLYAPCIAYFPGLLFVPDRYLHRGVL